MANGNSETKSNRKLNLPDLSARTLMGATLVVALVALGFWLLFRFHHAILSLLAGVIISVALKPAVDRLKARGLSPGAAVGLIYALLLVIALLLVRFAGPLIADQVATIGSQLGEGYESIRLNMRRAPNLLIQRLADALPAQPTLPATPPVAPAADTELAVSPFEQISGYLGLGANAIFQTVAIFVFAFFWTIESDWIKRSAVSLLPLNQRDSTRELFDEIEQRVSGYVNGQLLLSAIIGGLSLAAYLIIGLPYAPLLALFAGMMEIIPFIGPIIGAVPALIIGFTVSPLTAMWTVVASLIIHQLEANVFGPRVMKRTLGMRPLVTLLALTAFGSLFGVLGAIVALPLASVVQLLFDRLWFDAPLQTDADGARDKISLLRYETQELVNDMRKVSRRESDESEPVENGDEEEATIEDTLEEIALDLDSLLALLRETEVAA